MEEVHQQRMMQALQAAQSSKVRVSPNPKVGCVIYNQHHVCVATGVTDIPGLAHAEIKALHQLALWQRSSKSNNNVEANSDQSSDLTERLSRHPRRRKSSYRHFQQAPNELARPQKDDQEYYLYVTLEPCSHHGRTPPCIDAIIDAGITSVYIGTSDPNPQVRGRGIALLEQAGILVYLGIAESTCERWHAPFKKWITQGIPWVTLKGAMTLDGCLATAQGHSQWITGTQARTHVHYIRAQVDAVMVGGATARIDQPRLNVRHCEGEDPIAVVLSRTLALPKKLPCVREGTLCIHGPLALESQRQAWLKRGVELIEVSLDDEANGLDLSEVLVALGSRGITHLLVEGGGKLHASFIQADLIDDVMVYVAPKIIGRGRPLFALPSVPMIQDGWCLENQEVEFLGDDLLIRGDLKRIHSNNSEDVESLDDSEDVESLDDSEDIESLDDSEDIESLDDSEDIESLDDSIY
jgi:diaminohydroxyphosphoribosylaminopyrimidine deaminase / 5-amino-6-(5-phosphoribosylamino)uracil reductase